MKAARGIIHKIVNWEAWPFELLYMPLAIFWVGYMIKSKAVWFFTSSNPGLTFGGLEGEPKKEMYDLLPPGSFPPTFNVLPGEDVVSIRAKLSTHGVGYPFIVKPEVGGQGILLRKIDDEEALLHYHKLMRWEYIVQSLVTYPLEVSVFHIRHPNETKGVVTGFLQKIPLYVTGTGSDTLHTLVARHPKGEKRVEELYGKHKERWNEVLQEDEKYMLSYAANHNRGAQFVDLKEHIDEQLAGLFDTYSLRINDFFYGRYDIMCASIEDLKAGKNFAILEYNGCGAEPNHFYDTGYTLIGAYKEILKHWKALYQICKYNREERGIKAWPFQKGRKFLAATRKETKEMKMVDAAMG
ncbi:MAG: hypothetical protein V4725_01490 [Bacteroidota bacterium]